MLGKKLIQLVFGLTLMTSVWTQPEPGQVCYTVLGSNALDIHLIYKEDELNNHLWKRKDSLPNCDSSSRPVELDTCTVCQNETEVSVRCLLNNALAKLKFEGGRKPLKTTLPLPCESTTTPTAATTTTAPPTPALGVGYIILIVFGSVVAFSGIIVVVAAAVSPTAREKMSRIKSWKNRCSRIRVPTEDGETGMEMTRRPVTANGHDPPNPSQSV